MQGRRNIFGSVGGGTYQLGLTVNCLHANWSWLLLPRFFKIFILVKKSGGGGHCPLPPRFLRPCNAMESAPCALETGELGYKKASTHFGIPKSTLKRRHKGRKKTAKGSSKSLGRYKIVFTAAMAVFYVSWTPP